MYVLEQWKLYMALGVFPSILTHASMVPKVKAPIIFFIAFSSQNPFQTIVVAASSLVPSKCAMLHGCVNQIKKMMIHESVNANLKQFPVSANVVKNLFDGLLATMF